MRSPIAWAGVALLALGAGAALWWAGRPAAPVATPTIGPAAFYAASFRDLDGRTQPLGQFQGRTLVLNFWATWCAPCREEMPGFERLARRWSGRGVAFVGVSQEAPEIVARFARELRITYPLWVGGDEAGELARRLGNRVQALPFTVVLAPTGVVAAAKLGPYGEKELEDILARTAPNS